MVASIDWLRDLVHRYVTGDITLGEFEEAFIPEAWDVNEDSELSDAVAEIELRLAELSNGHWTEAEFKDLLRPWATRKTTAKSRRAS
jgi:hypothetical protein